MTRISRYLFKLRRYISRSEWAARILGLPRPEDRREDTGLILLQIDGLSRHELERAIEKGNTPFLKSLLQREDYSLKSLYSGLPSSTPAIQAELFYGRKTAVPAFQFKNRENGEIGALYQPGFAAAIQEKLEHQDGEEPLLSGGSAYADVFTGGAEDYSFCVTGMGWGTLLERANPFSLATVLLLHSFVFVRMIILASIELGLSVIDVFRGMLNGKDFFKEVKFIASRIAIGVLMRDFVTMNIKTDIARGVPVIHGNFLGYDEQSHRRGPSSAFAHWTLKGIDKRIRQIWESANRSRHRDYDLWIYSDHGQESTASYRLRKGKSIQRVVAQALAGSGITVNGGPEEIAGIQHKRGRILGSSVPEEEALNNSGEFQVAAMGPLAHVYLPEQTQSGIRREVAAFLSDKGAVPLVMTKNEDGSVTAWKNGAPHPLPEETATMIGPDHPFLKDVGRDLAEVARHPDAGDLVLSGWRPNQPLTFPIENGSHAGPGPRETGAFALIPQDAEVDASKDYLRPTDLRKAALFLLGRAPAPLPPSAHRPLNGDLIRIMTYNVHSCIGMDGVHSPERIARVVGKLQPDIIALQEIDVGRFRTNHVDQARKIADLLGMYHHFHASFKVREEQYGNAILSRFPLKVIRKGPLPKHSFSEQRGAIHVEVDAAGKRFQILCTHLGLRSAERIQQVQALLGEKWLADTSERCPVVVCCDLNDSPRSQAYRMVKTHFKDAYITAESTHPSRTWQLFRRLDYIFLSEEINAVNTEIPRFRLARKASDHFPFVADIRLP